LNEVKRHYLLPVDVDVVKSEIKLAIEGKSGWLCRSTEMFLENIDAAITDFIPRAV
jgi:hypothetical protein